MIQKESILLTIVDGYLGAGKTTLLNHIIRHTDCHLAIIINDFGDLDTPPDHVIVETSGGVVDPYQLGRQSRIPGFRLDGVIVLAGIETIRQKTKDKYVAETVTRQLHGADLLILIKKDLLDAKERPLLRAWSRNLVPDARIIEATQGIGPLPMLLGIGADSDTKPIRFDLPHHHNQDYDSWSYTSASSLDGEKYREMISSLPERILRTKGIL